MQSKRETGDGSLSPPGMRQRTVPRLQTCLQIFLLLSADPLPAGGDRTLGTYEDAEVASDAFLSIQKGSAVLSHANRLVAAVRAGYGASAAANAFVAVELGENH